MEIWPQNNLKIQILDLQTGILVWLYYTIPSFEDVLSAIILVPYSFIVLPLPLLSTFISVDELASQTRGDDTTPQPHYEDMRRYITGSRGVLGPAMITP